MSNISNIPISHYKVLSLPSVLEPNSVYYVLDQSTNIVEGYITSKHGVPIPLFNTITLSGGKVSSVTGTGVTGTASNPKVNISTFVSSQLGNLIYLSSTDGKLQVNPITSPDGSIEVSTTSTELQIKLAAEIVSQINAALKPGDNVSELVNNGDGTSPFATEELLNTTIAENKDKNYIHNQLSASNSWVLNHNLNKYGSVTIVDSGNTIVVGDVEYNSLNQITINFNASFSGKAYVN